MNTAVRSSALLSLALLTGACVDDSAETGALDFRCTGCTSGNSPRVNDYEFPDLNLDGEPNGDGVVLLGVLDPLGVPHELDVVDDEFVARNPAGTEVASRDAMVGWELVLRLPNSTLRNVRITAYERTIPSWATDAAPMTGYALAYDDPVLGVEQINVCPGSGEDGDDVSVTLISGETYDRALKRVYPGMAGWFTIACRDEAVYKMKRMNLGPNDFYKGSAESATPGQRQAAIKMITADYCGDGTSHTMQGQTVYWEHISGTVTTKPEQDEGPIELEAFWHEDGAYCLNNPRHVDLTDVACALPACPTTWDGAEWQTSAPI